MGFFPGGDRLRYGHRIRNRGCRLRVRYRSDLHPRIGGRLPLDAQGRHQPKTQQQGRVERHGNAEPQQQTLTLEASALDAAVRSGKQRHPLHIPRGRRQVDRARRPRRTHVRKLYNLIHGSSILVGNGVKRYAAVRLRSLLKKRPADCRTAPAALRLAYGWRLPLCVERVAITVRAHAMAIPRPGFLSNPGRLALRASEGPIFFAHSDLSGLSLFEEAAWWGYQAAVRIARLRR
jgi:hypothetical protein